MGGATGGVGTALAQPGHQHLAGAGGNGQQRVIAAGAGIAVVARSLLGQSIGLADGRVQVDAQGRVAGSGPSGPGPGQQLAAHAVELTDATVLGSTADLDPAVVRQFFRIIEDQADHMHDLVADLLDVARIETGTLPVTPEPAEVAVLVDRARSAFTSAGGRNNLDIDIETDLPLVMADRRRIVQVVGNLLSNAAKHSSESSVITVTVVRKDVHVAVSVADEGRGIPSERLPYLFRKFTRSDGDDLGSGVAGSGLGLAICKGPWRPTGAGYGPRARGWAWERGSPSRYRRSRIPGAARPSAFRLSPLPPRGEQWRKRGNGCASWRWTTTPRRSGTSATPS